MSLTSHALVVLTVVCAAGSASAAVEAELEGGADNDEVYSFAWLHYAVASLWIGF
jgi:hypothetical protein